MIVSISSDAEADISEGYWFYERQSPGLGDYFRSCLIADIESLAYYGGIHEIEQKVRVGAARTRTATSNRREWLHEGERSKNDRHHQRRSGQL